MLAVRNSTGWSPGGVQDIAADPVFGPSGVPRVLICHRAVDTGDLNAIRDRVSELEHDLSQMKRKVDELSQGPRIESALSGVSAKALGEAKAIILRLFKENDVLTYSDILEKTRFSLAVVLDACNELEQEGEIGSAD